MVIAHSISSLLRRCLFSGTLRSAVSLASWYAFFVACGVISRFCQGNLLKRAMLKKEEKERIGALMFVKESPSEWQKRSFPLN
jgi:hypothetical protein